MSLSARSASESIEAQVLDVVDELVAELRGHDTYRRASASDSLERDLGISSLERVELLVRLERALGVRLGDEAMAHAENPADLARAILAADPNVTESLPSVHTRSETAVAAPASARTIVDAFEWHAQRSPDRVHIHLRQDDGTEQPLTYGDVWRASLDVADGLTARGLGRHDTVAIMLRTEPAFFSAFFGTLLAGCIPAPMYPPFRADRIEEYALRQVAILRNANTRLMITFAEVERVTALLVGQAPALSAVVTIETLAREGEAAPSLALRRRRDDGDPALIQYTSGSTGQPKGVLLTHANLLANIRALEAGLAVPADEVGVSWLPLYHDMGLIGAWLGMLYLGAPLALMSPLAFLSRPARWLWALHAHRGTLSPAPNFAYDLCSLRIPDHELEGLDLSSVRVLLNGSEAVQPETLARFATRFAPYGLRREALTPVYGLAECSVGLAAPPTGRGPRIDVIDRREFQESGEAREVALGGEHESLQIVGCGRALRGHDIRVVGDSDRPLGDRREGRVQFRGPSATSGYYRNPDATRELIRSDGWLETGDLGYFAEGELFLSGRQKDLIIKGGRNLQPHEAEEVAATVSGVRKGCVAAFGVADPSRGTERFVIVAETRVRESHERSDLEAAIIERVATSLGVPPDTVVLTGPGAVLKTSSGKIRRSATRDAFERGRLDTRHSPVVQWARLGIRAGVGYVRRSLDRAARLVFTTWVIALLVVTGLCVWAALSLGPQGQWANRLVGSWVGLLFRLAGCPVEVNGLENLAGLQQAVFVANHSSFFDSVLIMSVLPVPLRFAVKARLAGFPFLGTAIRKGGHIPIEKGDLSQQIEGAGAVVAPLQAGESLFVFPEGTFVAAPGLLPFRLGAFRAAVEAGCPIVPVAIRGTRKMFPAGTMLLTRGPVTVTIGEPIHTTSKEWPEIVRLRDRAREVIQRGSDEPG